MKRSKFLHVLKHTFVPHHENDYKPHFFREHVILSLLIGSIFLLLLSFTSYIIIRTTTFGSSVVSSVLIDLTNQTRQKNNLPPLLYNQELEQAATLKGNDMINRQYFAHFAPDGTSPWHWFDLVGYNFLYAGENLAINFRSSTAVEKAWMASPKHRDNILGGQYEDIGIATIHGEVNSLPILFVVQLFGKIQPGIIPESLIPATMTALATPITAHLYQKIIFNASYYISNIYVMLIGILSIALLMMIFIEIKKQHYMHILLGVLLGIAVGICILINSLLL